jgi:drug/metabolite transporter (DMT)-like permease
MSELQSSRSLKLGLFLALFSAISFSLYAPASRAVYVDGGNSIFIILLTTFARAFFLWLGCILRRKSLFASPAAWRIALTGGAFQTASIFCVFGSLLYVPGPIMITILFTATLMLMLWSAYKSEVPLTRNNVITTLVTLVALTFVVNLWHTDLVYDWRGLVLAFGAAIATASRVYVWGKQVRERDPVLVGAESFIVAAAFCSVLLFFSMPVAPLSALGWGYAALASASLVLGTFGMLYGISYVGPFRFSLLMKLEPVFNALFSVLLINEVLAWGQYAGMAIVVIALAIYQLIEAKRSRAG